MTDQTVALAGEARSADRLAQWVQRRESVIAHDATNSIWHQVPAYGDRADAGLRDEVEAHCRQVFAAFLASVTERRHPLRSDFPWSGQHAMRRVELGITLSDFMKAFRVGQLTLWDDILAGVNEWPSTKDAALLLVSQVMRTIEVGSTAAFLCSPLGAGITGATVYVDKGFHAMGMAVEHRVDEVLLVV